MAIKKKHIEVNGVKITIDFASQSDFISLTDIARFKNLERTDTIIQNWLRNRNTIELLGFWEQLYNPNFKPLEFEGFRKQAGLNSFSPSRISRRGRCDISASRHFEVREIPQAKSTYRIPYLFMRCFTIVQHGERFSPSRVSRRGPCDIQLNQIAIAQMKSLLKSVALKKLNPS